MQEKITKGDFIELEFTGKTKSGEIFDTNIKEEAEKINLNIETRPLIICIGQNMILQAIDEFLLGKEIGEYKLELTPEKAFGKRNKELVKMMPLSVFIKHNIKPEPGLLFSFDGILGKILTSGSRILVDFNNPLADKEIIYELRIKRKVINQEEKVKSLILFYFKKELDFEIKDKTLIINSKEPDKRLIELFSSKFKEILNLELEVK